MEIIKIIDGSAGRTVTVTGLTQTTITQDNILGIINEGNGKTLYSPINRGNITGVTYSDGTLTITLKDTVTAIAAGDKVLVKLYFDDVASGGGDATEQNQETILSRMGDNDSGTNLPSTLFGWIMKVWNYISTTITNKLGSPDTGHTIAGDASTAANAAGSAATDAQTIKGRMGQASDTAAEGTDKSLFAWVKSIAGKFATIKEAIMGGGSGVGKSNLDVYNHIPSIPTDYAKESTLTDATNGLSAIKAAITALYGGDLTATLSALKTAIGNIDIDTTDLAKAEKLQDAQDDIDALQVLVGSTTDVSTDSTIFGKFAAVISAISALSIPTVQDIQNGLAKTTDLPTDYAKDSSVKDGNDTAISVTKDVQTKVGAKDSSDDAEPSTLFAWFRRLYMNIQSVYSHVYDAQNTKSAVSEAASANTKIGTNADNASDTASSGTIFGKLRAIIELLKNGSYGLSEIASGVSNAGTAAGTAANKAESADTKIGNKDDSADDTTTGSVFARLRAIINKIGANSDAAVEISGSGTIFGRLRAIIDNYLDNSQYGLSKIYTDAAKETAATTNKQAVMQHVSDTFVKVDFTEDGLPLTREGGMCPITDGTDVFDGDYDMYSTHETSYAVGTIIQCTADNEYDGSNDVYAFIKAGASNLGISSGNVVTGTFEFGTWKKGHYYRVAQIVEVTDLNNETTVHIFTYEELPATIVEGFDQTKEAVQAAKQAIKGSDAAATLTAIYAHLNGGGSLPADVQQQLTLILNYLGSPAAMSCEGMTPQEVVDELEDIFGIMGLDIAPCSVDSDGNVTAPSES